MEESKDKALAGPTRNRRDVDMGSLVVGISADFVLSGPAGSFLVVEVLVDIFLGSRRLDDQ